MSLTINISIRLNPVRQRFFGYMKKVLFFQGILLVAIVSPLLFVTNSQGAYLSGLMVFSTDGEGRPAGDFVWDTRANADFYKVFLSPGVPQGSPNGLTTSFINGPAWAQTDINIPLANGRHEFTMFFQNNGNWPAFGLNLFFQNTNLAQICVKAPARTNDTIPPFTPNSASPTYTMLSYPAPGGSASGTATAIAGGSRVTLVSYYVAASNVFSLDRVGTHSVGANARLDFVGTFTLVVEPSNITPPRIVSGPESQTVDAGGSVTFRVTAEGTPPLSYQWLKNGTPIPGATGSELTIDNAQTSHAGDYSVRVSNEGGAVVSGAARLTVIPPAGETAARLTGLYQFSVDSAGRPAGNFVWDTRGTVSDFYKAFLTPGTPGGFPDGLTGPFINGPTWAQAPIDLPLREGRNQFTVYFQHNGDWPAFGLNLFFQSNAVAQICAKAPARTGEAIPGFTANNAPVTYSMTSFPSPDAPASGRLRYAVAGALIELTDYYVAAANYFSMDRVGTHSTGANGAVDYVGTFTLNVERRTVTPPRIVSGPESQTVNIGASVTFRVTAEGTAPLEYQWSKGGSPIEGATSAELTIENVSLSSAGQYSVAVRNDAGTATASATLTVNPPPPPPGPRLTAAFVFSSDTSGNPAGNFVWDTRGTDSDFYKAYLTSGTPGGTPDGLTAPFINGPDWARTPINISLQEGTNKFTMFFQHNGDWGHFALNLFLQNSNRAQISVKAPARTGMPVPAFTPNSAPRTYSMTSYPTPNAPASGTTRAFVGDAVVDLTEYYVAVAPLFARDRVSTHSATANSRLDYVGTFTLVVRPRSELNGAPVARIDLSHKLVLPGAAHPFVVACDGAGARVTLDGRGSSDPDNDPLTFAWFAAGSAQPFSTEGVTTIMADIGTYTVNLRVSDGTHSANASLTFEVITPGEAVASLGVLLDSSQLSAKAQRPLRASLNTAIRAAEDGKFEAARNQLQAFQSKVEAQLGDTALARSLTEAAQAVIQNLDCSGH